MTISNYSVDAKVLNDNIKKIRIGSIALQNTIQETAIMAMVLHSEDNNATHLNNLIKAVGAGLKAKTLIEYIKAFTKASYDEQEKKFVHNKNGTLDLDGAKAVHWVDFKPEPKAKATDFMKQVKTLALKAVKELPDMKQADQIKAAKEVLALAKTLNIELEDKK
jgi:hypothetical protein